MRFQKYVFSLSSKTHRSIRVHTKVLVRFRLLQRTVVPKNRKSLQQLGSIDSLGNSLHGCHQAPSKTDKNAKTTRHLAHDSNEHYFS